MLTTNANLNAQCEFNSQGKLSSKAITAANS